MTEHSKCLHKQVIDIVRKDVAKLNHGNTVQQAMDEIREKGLGDRIIYFYVVDDDDHLVGVLPTRRLLTSPLDLLISEVMIDRVITIPQHATVLDAYDLFVRHKFLAFPVVDENRHILGVVDIEMCTEDVFDIADNKNMDTVFEMIGFRITQVREASILRAFRFPVSMALGHDHQRYALRATSRRLRNYFGQESNSGIFPNASAGFGRKCQYSVNDYNDS